MSRTETEEIQTNVPKEMLKPRRKTSIFQCFQRRTTILLSRCRRVIFSYDRFRLLNTILFVEFDMNTETTAQGLIEPMEYRETSR